MAIHILPTPNMKWGVSAEAGINISRFQVRYFPEQDERITGDVDQTLIRIQSQYFNREITVEGEIKFTPYGGLMFFTMGVACGLANTTSHFYPVAGTVYLDEATVTSARNGWVTLVMKLSSTARI
jgi:hypothetical protein